jgi:choline dehydrogenase
VTKSYASDFVVIGSGSAGSVITRRLIDAGATVTLLEAGGTDTNPAIHDPGRVLETWGSSDDWQYLTAPQAYACDRRLSWPRGKVLGGSSSLNGMIYVRGIRGDYDHWAYLGNDGWSWRDVLPLFKRSESWAGGEDDLRGGGGPLNVTMEYERHPLHESFVAGAQEIGVPYNSDYNRAEIEGISFFQLCTKDGKRQSTWVAFVGPVAAHPNLTVLTGALATRLRFEGSRCVGVEFSHNGLPGQVRARGEVIVSCGVIESPRLLMLSGIGPGSELRRLGIDVRVDLPGVGENLHDHAVVPLVYAAEAPVPSPPAGTWAGQAHLFARSRPGLTAPDLQPLLTSVPAYDPTWMEGPPNGFTFMPGIIRPASRGSLRLRSADPNDELAIDPQYLSCEADIDAMLVALALCREIGRSGAVAEWGPAELYPGPAVETQRELRDYIRRCVGTYHHQVGTCKMGVDAQAVVDPKLRVYGVEGLRVADASIMPAVSSGNTHAPAMMIGEKASDLLLAASQR